MPWTKPFTFEPGTRFGRRTVIRQVSTNFQQTLWECRCDCGRIKVLRGYHLMGGEGGSCGTKDCNRVNAANRRRGPDGRFIPTPP